MDLLTSVTTPAQLEAFDPTSMIKAFMEQEQSKVEGLGLMTLRDDVIAHVVWTTPTALVFADRREDGRGELLPVEIISIPWRHVEAVVVQEESVRIVINRKNMTTVDTFACYGKGQVSAIEFGAVLHKMLG